MTFFFRLLETDDKGTALNQAIQQLAQKQPNPNTFAVEPESFQQVPGAPFAYWVSEGVLSLFRFFKPVSQTAITQHGASSKDDFRFLRVFWESNQDSSRKWFPFAKGGSYSTFYADVYLVINWADDAKELEAAILKKYPYLGTNAGWVLHRECLYFHPGLTYPRRTSSGLSVRVMPKDCIFADKGPAIFVTDDNHQYLLALLALTNSSAFQMLVEVQLAAADAAARSYEVGIIQRTPIPDLTPEAITTLATLAHRAWTLKRSLDTVTQTSHAFVLPALLQVNISSLSDRAKAWTVRVIAVETELAQIQTQIDELVFDLYGIGEGDRAGLNSRDSVSESAADTDSDDDEDDSSHAADLPSLTNELLAYTLSVAFGRFDVRLATGDSLRDGKVERSQPTEPEPFDPLPVCSPGMLVGDSGLCLIAPTELPAAYPVQIPFNGILVDDEGHPNDLINRIQDVLKVIWGDKDSDIEQEACEILKVSSLRDYFHKPAAFFNAHLTRYSKSRRQAPIYLPLSTRSGSYTLWLYYHRLTDQTLYSCINDYVEPKLRQVSQAASQLHAKDSRSRNEEETLEELQNLESELQGFHDELLSIAQLPWKPNLNDGVQLTVAPLWSLFRLSKWQKKLKETWEKQELGDYDWANLAYTIWTNRVREKCKHSICPLPLPMIWNTYTKNLLQLPSAVASAAAKRIQQTHRGIYIKMET